MKAAGYSTPVGTPARPEIGADGAERIRTSSAMLAPEISARLPARGHVPPGVALP